MASMNSCIAIVTEEEILKMLTVLEGGNSVVAEFVYADIITRILFSLDELCSSFYLYNFICLLSQVQRVLSFSYVQQSASFQEVSKMAFNNKFQSVKLNCVCQIMFFFI